MAAATNYLAVIKVVGIGGGGVNAVNRMIDSQLRGIEFIAANTDQQAPHKCRATVQLQHGHPLAARPAEVAQEHQRLL